MVATTFPVTLISLFAFLLIYVLGIIPLTTFLIDVNRDHTWTERKIVNVAPMEAVEVPAERPAVAPAVEKKPPPIPPPVERLTRVRPPIEPLAPDNNVQLEARPLQPAVQPPAPLPPLGPLLPDLVDFDPHSCRPQPVDPWDRSLETQIRADSFPQPKCPVRWRVRSRLARGFMSMLKNREAKDGEQCEFTCVFFDDHRSNVTTQPGGPIVYERAAKCPIAEVRCKKGKRTSYKNVHIQLRERPQLGGMPAMESLLPGIHVIVLESASASQLHRSFPQTLHFLRTRLDAVEFPHLNRVGDTIEANYHAFLTGHPLDAGPLVPYGKAKRRKYEPPFFCDTKQQKSPSIFAEFKRRGYFVLFDEDRRMGIFDERRCPPGASLPYDHYFGTYFDRKRKMFPKRSPFLSSESLALDRYESKNPFLHVVLPKGLRKRADLAALLKRNSAQLLNHYDVYATLVDLIRNAPTFNERVNFLERPAEPKAKDDRTKGTSLFRSLPVPRTCNSLEIPLSSCGCGLHAMWVNATEVAAELAEQTLALINRELKKQKETVVECEFPVRLHSNASEPQLERMIAEYDDPAVFPLPMGGDQKFADIQLWRLYFRTQPEGLFEAYVKMKGELLIELDVDKIRRVDRPRRTHSFAMVVNATLRMSEWIQYSLLLMMCLYTLPACIRFLLHVHYNRVAAISKCLLVDVWNWMLFLTASLVAATYILTHFDERLLIITRPFDVRRAQLMTFGLLIGLISITVVYSLVQLLPAVRPADEIVSCRSFGCLLSAPQATERLSFLLMLSVACSVVMVVFFLVFLQVRKRVRTNRADRSNTLIVAVIVNQLAIECMPVFLTLLLLSFGVNLTNHYGPILITMGGLDGMVTITVYSWTVRPSHRSQVLQNQAKAVSTPNTTAVHRF
ncbi:hypothetical protein M3Y99_00647600 [Aphelenchoides fujianensis]|nr:hypothetical protein M3Y99_00647600 [Aphelenchoides fujianensis]